MEKIKVNIIRENSLDRMLVFETVEVNLQMGFKKFFYRQEIYDLAGNLVKRDDNSRSWIEVIDEKTPGFLKQGYMTIHRDEIKYKLEEIAKELIANNNQ